MLKKFLSAICVCACVFFAGIIVQKEAYAGLMITPTQVVFEGRDHYADVTLINNGKEERNYELDWVFQKMQPDTGSYYFWETSEDDLDISKHITLSPKRVRLAPGAKQKIRLVLRRPAEVAAGDYHAHLKFKALANESDNDADKKLEGVRAAVGINVSYTIPVIFRAGEPYMATEIGRIDLERNSGTGLLNVLVPVIRSSESPYAILGYMWVYHVSADGHEELVGELSNAHIFPEIDTRTFEVLLTKDIKGGSLRVVLRNWDEDSDYVYAERSFALE